MPWEKSFDMAKATEDAMKLFWRKGYVGSSLNDLIEATGVNRGSLYNAFGGKQALFVEALLRYDTSNRKATLAKLAAMGEPLLAIRTLFDGLVQESIQDTEKKGCFLVNTALELPHHEPEVQEIVRNGMGELENFFREMIEQGQGKGEIPNDIPAAETAKSLVSLFVGIRVMARGAFDEKSLRASADQALRLVSS